MSIRSEFGQAVEAQLSRSITPQVRRELWQGEHLDRQRWEQFANSGWFSALLPEQLDGLGLQPDAIVDLFEAVGRYLVPGPFLEHVLLVPLLVANGADLPELANLSGGARLLSWWDAQATGSTAPLRFKGVSTISATISGQIDGVRFAADADAFLLTVEGPNGCAIGLVDRSGISSTVGVGPTDPVTRAGRLTLDRTPIRLLLEGDLAMAFLDAARTWCRIATAIELSGSVGWLVEQSAEFAKTRRQFGQPIGQFQALAHILAEMAVHDIALQNLCAAVVEDVAADASIAAPDAIAAMGAKAYASRVALDIAESALQVHGGIGFTMEHPLHMYFKHALHLWAWYGDPARLSIEIARRSITV
jgi:alkylation response protein AidB-like acyl-CoA dehydrogenase